LVSSRRVRGLAGCRVRLQVGEDPAAGPEPADRGGDPHPFDLGGRAAGEFERAASGGFGVEGGG